MGAKAPKEVLVTQKSYSGRLAFDPETEAFVTYRVPTLGFFIRELEAFDGGIWTVYSNDPAKHVEKDPNQETPVPRLVKFEFPR